MKCKKIVLAAALLLAILFLTACRSIVSTLNYKTRTSDAEKRLGAMMQQLPRPPDGVLVKLVNTSTGGQMPECAGRQIQALWGTNELSFEEVLKFYASSLQVEGWHLNLVTDRGRGFDRGDEFSLEISDLYEVSLIGKDAVREGKSKFRTIYLLNLLTPVELPFPAHCKGG